jgi:hypothetical protein
VTNHVPVLYHPFGHCPAVITDRLPLDASAFATQPKPGWCTHALRSKYVMTLTAGKLPSVYTARYCARFASQVASSVTPSQLVTANSETSIHHTLDGHSHCMSARECLAALQCMRQCMTTCLPLLRFLQKLQYSCAAWCNAAGGTTFLLRNRPTRLPRQFNLHAGGSNTDRADADWLSTAKLPTLVQWASGAAEEPQPIALLFWCACRQQVHEINHHLASDCACCSNKDGAGAMF